MRNEIIATAMLMTCGITTVVAQNSYATVGGVVLDENAQPVIGAGIRVKNESTGFTTRTVTDKKGAYTIPQLPLGGPYIVTCSYIGYANQERRDYQLNQGDNVRIDFRLSVASKDLQEVVVVSNTMKQKVRTLGEATSITQKDMATMPMNGRNFTALTDLSPLSKGENIGGQIATSTGYTIDGMNARSPIWGGASNNGPYLLSTEAIREFEVVTNNYDVTYGRAGGGTISAVTRSGTNQFHGAVFGYYRGDKLSSKYDVNGNRNSSKYTTSQFGFALGGPIVKDKLHFYASFEQQLDSRPLIIADIHGTDDEKRYGISKENLDHFIDVARNQYGVSKTQPQVGSFDKRRPTTTAFLRLDWQIDRNNLLTLRDNMNYDKRNLQVSDNSKINLYEVYGNAVNSDNSLMLSLRSTLGTQMTNELKFQYLYTNYDGQTGKDIPSQNIPRAIVENIKSTIDGQDYTLSTIQLGGQRYSPEFFKNNCFQLVDNFYWNTDRINYTFGADLMYTRLNSRASNELNGRFYYASMADFENNTPYRYAREVPIGNPNVKQSVLDGAIYAQAKAKLFTGADLTAGLRSDFSHYYNNPASSELLTDRLGLSTTNGVASYLVEPRMQFYWDIKDRHTDILKVGGGVLGSNMNNYAMVNNLQFDGQRIVSIDVSGDGVPRPDFNAYRQNPATAPGAELFDQLGIEKVATYNVNSADVKMPVVYKANINYTKFITDRLRVGASLYGSWTRNNYTYVDRNMVDEPYFRLDNEGGRGVYVPASTISANGTTNWMNSRKDTSIGRVLELVSKGKVNTYSFVIDASYRYYKDGQITVSYTWNSSKDNTSYNGNVANSATRYHPIVDDPRDLSTMSYSDNQFRHKIVVYGTLPTFHGFKVGFRYSGIGGTRYSIVANGNMNGDFVAENDLAFVFDPNDPSTPENIREGLNTLLNNPDIESGFKDYVRDSFGKVAKRNGGVNPFTGVLDLKVSKGIKLFNTHALNLSVDVFNVGNIFNKKWGLSKDLGKQYLLNVKGFDQTKREFVYSVNPNAGKTTYSGTPWQIQIGARYSF